MKEEDHRILIKKVKLLNSCFIEMDTTLISEIDYINILPDMDMDDSSFLKTSLFVNNKNGDSKNDVTQQENEEQL